LDKVINMVDIGKLTQVSRFKPSELEPPKEEPKEEIERYYCYPLYVKQLQQLKIEVPRTLDDDALDNFMRIADPEKTKTEVSVIIRLKEKDVLNDNKKKEFMFWYTNHYGFDRTGHIIPSLVKANGQDKQVRHSVNLDHNGKQYNKIEDEYSVYTVLWNVETFDEILESTGTDPDKIQYIVNGYRSWGGFSYDEFRNLTFEELAEKGKLGKVQEPVPAEKIITVKPRKSKK
jgi:hypothetical protein